MPMGCLDLPHRMLRNQRKSLVVKQLKRCSCLAQPGAAGGGQPTSGSSSLDDAAAASSASGAGTLCGCGGGSGGSGFREPRALLGALLKHLDLDRLDLLSQAVQSRGLERTECVPLDDRDASAVAGADATAAHLQRLCCAAWRWPDLTGATELRPLPACARAAATAGRGNGGSSPSRTSPAPQSHRSCCINPYHWSRVLSADVSNSDGDVMRFGSSSGFAGNVTLPSSAPELASHSSKSICSSAGSYSETRAVSTATDGGSRSSWCQLAYWELRQRVGPLFPVYDDTVDVFHDTPEHGGSGGLSLLALRQQQHMRATERCTLHECGGDNMAAAASRERVARVRAKIGLGITLHREHDSDLAAGGGHCDDAKRPPSGGDSVWLYNRSELPVFVSSCLLGGSVGGCCAAAAASTSACSGDIASAPQQRLRWPAHRLPPGYCVRVYDRETVTRATRALRSCSAAATATGRGGVEDGPVDFHSIHVSFAKGWGAGYSRQSVTSCACWLEILVDAANR